jgi:hypothetical protein
MGQIAGWDQTYWTNRSKETLLAKGHSEEELEQVQDALSKQNLKIGQDAKPEPQHAFRVPKTPTGEEVPGYKGPCLECGRQPSDSIHKKEENAPQPAPVGEPDTSED